MLFNHSIFDFFYLSLSLCTAPDSPPYNCIARPFNSTAMSLAWSVPLQPNGLIQNYTISYQALYSISGLSYESTAEIPLTTESNSTVIVVNDLFKATSYNFSLQAFTIVGGSPRAVDICSNITLEDSKYIIYLSTGHCITEIYTCTCTYISV